MDTHAGLTNGDFGSMWANRVGHHPATTCRSEGGRSCRWNDCITSLTDIARVRQQTTVTSRIRLAARFLTPPLFSEPHEAKASSKRSLRRQVRATGTHRVSVATGIYSLLLISNFPVSTREWLEAVSGIPTLTNLSVSATTDRRCVIAITVTSSAKPRT
jgi:hypothetical protein